MNPAPPVTRLDGMPTIVSRRRRRARSRGRGCAGGGRLPYARMEHRRLGSTGLQVSRLALGCGNFGGIGSAPEFFGKGENEAEARALMDRAFEAGLKVVGTAGAYRARPGRNHISRRLHTR